MLLPVLTVIGPAQAETVLSARDRLVSFNQIDSDSNGYVSRVEARSVVVVETHFESADANNDGLLDRDEYVSLPGSRDGD